MIENCRFFAQVSFLALLAGCASIDFDEPKSESHALTATTDTFLGRKLTDTVAAHPGEAGFYPIYDGKDSLALRLLLIGRAEKSIDAQYFLIHDDLVGNVFVNALLKAANRGVRVRFLLDDVLSQGLDPGLAILNSHENFEVRIFNPFAHRSARAMDVTNLGRVTRRMHNKSLTADNQITLIGGRNIANEYFDASTGEKFGDLDVLAIGPIVPEVSSMFDTYWNHRAAIPMEALAEVPDNAAEALATLGEKVEKSLQEAESSIYAEAVERSIRGYIDTDASAFRWATYDLVYDSPDKSSAATVDESEFMTNQMTESIGEINDTLFVVTPYFVLLKDEVDGFRKLRGRNVSVTVLTNSLASNNHAAVHGGYSPSRKPLLESGVNLYELRASLSVPVDEPIGDGVQISTLHAKAFVVDRESIFIGSFNWNQRSINRDTELGVVIHSPEIATEFIDLVSGGLSKYSFELFLNESDKIRWRITESGEEIIVSKEPQTGFWRRFSAGFLRFMPIKSQL